MKVRFLHDFGGRETRELRYVAGQVVELEREVAEMLVRDGRAVFVDESGEELKLAHSPRVPRLGSDEAVSLGGEDVPAQPKSKSKRGKK